MFRAYINKMFLKLISFILFVMLLSACASNSTKPEIVIDKEIVKNKPLISTAHKAEYDKGLSFLQTKQYDNAQAVFTKLIDVYPELTGAYVNLALCYSAQSNDEEAEKLLGKALQIDPNHIDALIQKAALSQKAGAFKDVERYLLTANKIDKSNELVQFNLGVLYELYLQQYDDAIEHYQNYLALTSNSDSDTVKLWIKLLERK